MSQLTRRQCLAAMAGSALTAQSTTRKPNVALILSDDQGYGD